MRVKCDPLNLDDCTGEALLMGNQPVDVRRGSIYLFVNRACPEVLGGMSGVSSTVSGLQRGCLPLWSGLVSKSHLLV